ncbi:MAG TPA: ChaB family protein [Oculatellaceae cyanobacterium]
MPYSSIFELPVSVRHSLPEHAQEIFMMAFNSAYEEQRFDEVRAFKIAWAAVKRRYEKREGKWIPKAVPVRGGVLSGVTAD